MNAGADPGSQLMGCQEGLQGGGLKVGCNSVSAGQSIWYYWPQQLARPNLLSLLATPIWALSEMSVTPVSV